MTPGPLLLVVRPDQAEAFAAAWPEGVQIIVDRRQGERRVKTNPRVAIQRRHGERRRRPWVDAGLQAQGAMLVRP